VENLASDSFDLTDDEIKAISMLDQGLRFNDPGMFADTSIYD
jgi:hypothetical protein